MQVAENTYAGVITVEEIKAQKMNEVTVEIEWLENENRDCGCLCINKNGTPFNPGMVTKRLKFYANKYGINPEVMYPHSFRHRFAKNFIKKDRDIALLADLMGHESIETTRIYLRMTVTEQREIVDRIITW